MVYRNKITFEAISAGNFFCIHTLVCHAFWVPKRVCKCVRAKIDVRDPFAYPDIAFLHTRDCIPVTDTLPTFVKGVAMYEEFK